MKQIEFKKFIKPEIILFGIIFLIILANALNHPIFLIYDVNYHEREVLLQSELGSLFPQFLTKNLAYNPYLPYYLMGKLNMIFSLGGLIKWHPFYMLRIFQGLMFVFLGYLFTKKLTKNSNLLEKIAVGLLFFLVPNTYLSLVMIRADHMLALLGLTIFYLWYFKGLRTKIQFSNKYLYLWLIIISFMANTRHIAVAYVGVFFLLGCYEIIFNTSFSKIKKVTTIFLAFLFSIHFYGLRFVTSGHLFHMEDFSAEHKKYRELRKNFDRTPFFTNMEFDKVLIIPNRGATQSFKEVNGSKNSFFPKVYADMWGDYWLYFSGSYFDETKATFKRVALIAGIPLTILIIISSLTNIFNLATTRSFTLFNTASLVGFLGFLLFMFINYLHPEVGKNGFSKFSYYSAYFWAVIIGLIGYLKSLNLKLRNIIYIYIVGLKIVCLPLYIYFVN